LFRISLNITPDAGNYALLFLINLSTHNLCLSLVIVSVPVGCLLFFLSLLCCTLFVVDCESCKTIILSFSIVAFPGGSSRGLSLGRASRLSRARPGVWPFPRRSVRGPRMLGLVLSLFLASVSHVSFPPRGARERTALTERAFFSLLFALRFVCLACLFFLGRSAVGFVLALFFRGMGHFARFWTRSRVVS